MPQPLIWFLLIGALLLPTIGAVVLRIYGPRMPQPQVLTAATLLVAIPIISALVLSRSGSHSLRLGNVTLLFTEEAPASVLNSLPPIVTPSDQQPAETVAPETTAVVTATALVTETAAPAAPTAGATEPPTATAEQPTAEQPTTEPPTATPEPPTVEPPTATAEPPTAPPAPERRTYTVQPGDTLRSIAEQFNVSVQAILEANNLTPEQADALRIGQELVIP